MMISRSWAFRSESVTVNELDAALRDFAHRYNNHWIIGRLGYKTPLQHRRSFLVETA